ncbi:MAG: cupin domain-containing protein [Clostridiales bacterium]|nr:cupin domain-containing protein [Clostridiales bacterium]HOA85100.1 cupin domain-containing protein [Bacillota bacterium]
MLIDFSKIDTESIANFRGGEGRFDVKMYVDPGKNKIMCGRLAPGASIGMHRHEGNCEIIYFLEGRGRMLTDGGVEEVGAGLCHYCPAGHEHSLINDGKVDLVFFAVVAESATSATFI